MHNNEPGGNPGERHICREMAPRVFSGLTQKTPVKVNKSLILRKIRDPSEK